MTDRRTIRRGGVPRGPGPRSAFATLFSGSPSERTRFILMLVLIVLVVVFGGASRPEVPGLLVLRPAAVVLATVILLLPGPVDRGLLRSPVVLLLAFSATMLIQLVPLPPGLWLSLPGHARYAEAAAAAAVPQPWRAISLAPDLTLNSLVSLFVPGAVLLGAAALRPDQRIALLPVVLVVAGGSAVLGLLQVTAGTPFYPYSITNIGRPVGFFANINHQSALLAVAFPILAAWVYAEPPQAGPRATAALRLSLGLAFAAFLFAAVLVGGSRGGLLLAAIGLASVPLVIGDRLPLRPAARRLAVAGGLVVPMLLIAAAWLAGRSVGIDRLLGSSTSNADARLSYLPITLGLFRDHLPIGTGFGTFASAFRGAEPDAILKPTYFNHAHNDLLELGITGGLPALAVVAAYCVWIATRAIAVFGSRRPSPADVLPARAGVVAVVILLAASLIDYPLRTPLVASIFALASIWAANRSSASRV